MSKTDFFKNRGYDQVSFKKEKKADFNRALCVGVFSEMQGKFCLENMEDLLSLKNTKSPDFVEIQLSEITKHPTPTTPDQKARLTF
ncbi:hypothetical protein [Helicobacter suis]|uniref:hypothetical protein n=1 Tax=Helicobacter suis TaxID=104628 RepID=UPI0013D384C7|nr:hypothetical protein [Helicobacter suis]